MIRHLSLDEMTHWDMMMAPSGQRKARGWAIVPTKKFKPMPTVHGVSHQKNQIPGAAICYSAWPTEMYCRPYSKSLLTTIGRGEGTTHIGACHACSYSMRGLRGLVSVQIKTRRRGTPPPIGDGTIFSTGEGVCHGVVIRGLWPLVIISQITARTWLAGQIATVEI